MQLSFGPNMRRLLEMDAETLQVRVTAGPGDTLMWEVRSAGEPSGIRLELVGRGPDIEAAAAALLPLLSLHGSALRATASTGQRRESRTVVRESESTSSQPAAAFETSWVEDGAGLWHRSTHPVGYVESTNPWIFTTLCGQELETPMPPPLHPPEAAELCPECAANDGVGTPEGPHLALGELSGRG
jgi:hypothetical protein